MRRQSIGIIFQAFHLVQGLTVQENVAFPLLLRGEAGRVVADRVEEVLALVGMTQRGQHRPSELSGGEQQRVAVAQGDGASAKLILWPMSRPAISIPSTELKSSRCCAGSSWNFIRPCYWSRIAPLAAELRIIPGR